jgi:hypothetical protein
MSEQLQIYITEGAGYLSAEEESLVRAKESFDALGDTLRDAVLPLRAKLREIPGGPAEVEISLDLALKAEAKWVVVSATAEATIRVKLVWKT